IRRYRICVKYVLLFSWLATQSIPSCRCINGVLFHRRVNVLAILILCATNPLTYQACKRSYHQHENDFLVRKLPPVKMLAGLT
ncbi:hypothetical protein BCR43DRAFT_499237, partial [Syncephalastrum racemosum]